MGPAWPRRGGFVRRSSRGRSGAEEWLEGYDGPQFYHDRLEDLLAALAGQSALFDLCLDPFNIQANGSYRGDLWSDAEVARLIDGCGGLILDARVVTVSLSFSHSGTLLDTRHFARVVLPRTLHHLEVDVPGSD